MNGTRKRARRGFGFAELVEIFGKPYHLSQKQDDPEQWRAIGWVGGQLVLLIYEEGENENGRFYRLVTYWSATKSERTLYEQG